MAAEVDAVEAETARDRDVLCGEVDEERAALVRARAVALGEREQLVGDDDAGDLPRWNARAAGAREQVDVREHRRRAAARAGSSAAARRPCACPSRSG